MGRRPAPAPPAARHHRPAGGAGDARGADGYNDFIHHNSFRPNAAAFKPNSAPSLRHGNILLVTEEDYEQTDCTPGRLVPDLARQAARRRRRSAIVPLDKVELSDLGTYPLPQGAFCSAHWFDYRPGGIVAIGYYGGGTQLIDVRNPRRLKPYGHAFWGASEVWDAMWVPRYDASGRADRRDSNVVYAIDLVRGLDVYSVDVPGDGGPPADRCRAPPTAAWPTWRPPARRPPGWCWARWRRRCSYAAARAAGRPPDRPGPPW